MEKRLSVGEALRYARHDFMNDLQLILMYIDLGKTNEVKDTIHHITEQMRTKGKLPLLGLPLTVEWIETFNWLYTSFTTTLSCETKAGVRNADDQAVVSYLNEVFKNIEPLLAIDEEYIASIDISSTETDWRISFTIKGPIKEKPALPVPEQGIEVDDSWNKEQWSFTIQGQ